MSYKCGTDKGLHIIYMRKFLAQFWMMFQKTVIKQQFKQPLLCDISYSCRRLLTQLLRWGCMPPHPLITAMSPYSQHVLHMYWLKTRRWLAAWLRGKSMWIKLLHHYCLMTSKHSATTVSRSKNYNKNNIIINTDHCAHVSFQSIIPWIISTADLC